MITDAQVRAARQLLGWSTYDFSYRCRLPNTSICVFENTGRMQSSPFNGSSAADRLVIIRSVMEAAGIAFTGGEQPGVTLRKGET